MDLHTTAPPPHGGRLAQARRLFPDAPEPFLDLSTGLNPNAYPMPPISCDLWRRLPEPEAVETLQTVAARAYRAADPAFVVASPGTQIIIGLLPHLLGRREAVILGPTYAGYARAWQSAGVAAREVPQLGALERAPVAIVCNPNNPDGRRIAPDELAGLADHLAKRGGLLVVDEAFGDFDPALSVVPLLPQPALIVLRSFGKAFGLGGLRMGFALAAPALAGPLRAALGPWAVSGPAVATASAALADGVWHRSTALSLSRTAAALDDALAAAGLSILGGTALFRLTVRDDAPALFDHLGRAGILVRRFDEHPAWLRFGLPPDQAGFERLCTALRA